MTCPRCGSKNIGFIKSRRLWQCKDRSHPKAQFSIKVGTIFEDSAIGLDKWLVERHGEVRASVIDTRRKKNVQDQVREHVEAGAAIFTDELLSYDGLDDEYMHSVINHAEEYVRGNVHTNGMENFWSLLKRGIGGIYVSVEPFHLFRYVDEQAWRYNNRKDMNDGERFTAAASKIVASG